MSIPLEFNVLAGGWSILTDHPSWVAAGAGVERAGVKGKHEAVAA